MRMKESVVLALILTLFFVWTFLSKQVSAQTRARTESGKEVILYSDGT
jgi:regulatory protein YycI of two-component signal transduction system YycFG